MHNNKKIAEGPGIRKKKKSNDNFIVLWTLTAILISVLISFGILLAIKPSFVSDFISKNFGGLAADLQNAPALPAFLGGKENILIMGVDSNAGSSDDPFKNNRSDSLILVTINPLTKSANAISIPRDSKVYIADGHGINKINAAHAFGGEELTVKTVEQTLGIKINHYIAVDYGAIKELVSVLNGVPVNVEKRMHYVDRSGHLNINLNKGYQVLDPTQAEGYLRFRHDAIGDIGRMKRQQWFVKGVISKMQSPEVIPKVPQIIKILSKYVKTDMNVYDLSQLAAYSKMIDLDDIQTATLPGGPSRFGRVSYWILNTNRSQEIIDRLVYGQDGVQKDTPLTFGILYNKDSEYKVPELKAKLEQLGYIVNCKGVTKDPHKEIYANTSYASYKTSKELKTKVPELKSAQFVVSSIVDICGSSDFTIVMPAN